MLAAQATREERLAVADDVIRNDADIASLRDQVEQLHRQYVTAASNRSFVPSDQTQSDNSAK
jgi:dephospho-CoA kinase